MGSRKYIVRTIAVILLAGFVITSRAQKPKPPPRTTVIDATDAAVSQMRPIIEYYVVDRASLQRSYPVPSSPVRRERFRKFYSDALARIEKLDFDSMSQAGKVDYILFRSHVEHELRQLDIEAKQLTEIQSLVPFAQTIIDLEETRRRMEPIDSAKAAATLNDLKKQVDELRRSLEAGLKGDVGNVITPKKTIAFRAVAATNNLRTSLRNW